MTPDIAASAVAARARAVFLFGTVAVALLGAVPLGPAPADGRTPGGYGWPLSPRPVVSRGFEPPPQRWLAGHRGVDLVTTAGAPVFAAGSGVVRFAGRVGGRPVISIAHPDGVITTYEPVSATVAAGTAVVRGTRVGVVSSGHPGCAGPTCLHWGARRGTGAAAVYLDPRALLGLVRVRLKPVD